MNPAWSVIAFTTLAGAAQGLVVALALAALAGITVSAAFQSGALLLALVMLLAALAASFLHLGRPGRAWRAVLMWRTSWLSREVIVLPLFIAAVAGWWLAGRWGDGSAARATAWPLLLVALAALLWWCTAMIYACLRMIAEWAHRFTLASFALTGLSSGLVLASALAAGSGQAALLALAGPWALAITLGAGTVRLLMLQRNAALRPRSTLQSATGIRAYPLVQVSMGMTGGSFNTREFFHRASAQALGQIKLAALLLGFGLPALALGWGVGGGGGSVAFSLALLLQAPGLLAERWLFFAQARHPQNLYYQVVG